MKKLFIFAMALGLAACVTDKSGNNGNESGDADVNYLSINIISADGGLTRATGDYDDQNGYVDGNVAESKVSSIRFYFFDEDGDPVYVNASGNKNYRDWETSEATGNVEVEDPATPSKDAPNVEHILRATVTLEKPAGSTKLPAKVIAIINPDATIIGLGERKEDQLLGSSATTGASGAYFGQTEGKFVMSNSVYASGTTGSNPQKHCASSLEGCIQSTPDLAKENPVTIYVERLMAKVDLSYGAATTGNDKLEATELGNGSWGFDTGKTYAGIAESTDPDQKIYVRFEGYNVTTTTDKEYLLKHINEAWPNSYTSALAEDNLFQTAYEPWSFSQFFRSFWAINPTGITYKYGIYSDEDPEGKLFPGSGYENRNPALKYKFNIKEDGTWGDNIVYLPENAGYGAAVEDAATKTPSQVIIAATLVDKAGNALDLAEYVGALMLQDDLATAMLAVLSPKFAYEDGNKITSLTEDDVEFKTAWQLNGSKPEDGERLYVYLQLKEGKFTANTKWYSYKDDDFPQDPTDAEDWKATHGTLEDSSDLILTADVNQALKNLGPAKIWNEGATYYYFDIRHLARPVINDEDGEPDQAAMEAVPGYYGVVRNHVYKTKITSLVGLGTPVYDPDEIIIPEKPGDEKVYMAAEIRILSWRIVNSDVTLDW